VGGAATGRRPRAILPRLGLPSGPWNAPRPDEATLAAESVLLPERADVWWRPLIGGRELDAYARAWTATMVLHVVVFLTPGLVLLALEPWSFPVALMCAGWAWVVPDLYAARGANVVRPRPTRAGAAAEERAQGMLGDLLGHEARELYAATGLAMERGTLGVWLVADGGALLVRGRVVHCFCVRVAEPKLPRADRTAHLLLALRADERAFATVANRAFCGARRRVRRRLPAAMRPAVDRAAQHA
jgi:hypothetical protein